MSVILMKAEAHVKNTRQRVAIEYRISSVPQYAMPLPLNTDYVQKRIFVVFSRHKGFGYTQDMSIGADKNKFVTFKGTILDYVVSDPDLSTLLAAVKTAGLAEAVGGLKDGTLVAPTNAAFNALGFETKSLLESKILKDVLLYHVTTKRIDSKNLMGSMSCTHASLDGSKMWMHTDTMVTDAVGRSSWIEKLVACSNGTVLVVCQVLLPQRLTSVFGAHHHLPEAFVKEEFTPGHNHH